MHFCAADGKLLLQDQRSGLDSDATQGLEPKQGYPEDAPADDAAVGGKAASIAPVAAAVASGMSEKDAKVKPETSMKKAGHKSN